MGCQPVTYAKSLYDVNFQVYIIKCLKFLKCTSIHNKVLKVASILLTKRNVMLAVLFGKDGQMRNV